MVSWTKAANELLAQLDEVIATDGNCTDCGDTDGKHYSWCTGQDARPISQADLDYVKQSLGVSGEPPVGPA